MNKKVVKIITCVLAIVLLVGFVCTTVHAAGSGSMVQPKDISATYEDASDLMSMAGKVMGFIRNIAVIGGVILLMVLGVKYMVGSVEEKADYKKSLMPLVIGILIVMAATTIMTFVINFFA